MNDVNKDLTRFVSLSKLSQPEMKDMLASYMKSRSYKTINEDGFLYCTRKDAIPVLLVAHMDTVHKELPNKFEAVGDTLSSPQGIGGDDRCGIFAIMELVKRFKCQVLFTEDEEAGCVGAKKFVDSKYIDGVDVKYCIEIDRRGKTDAVYYECDNPDFEDYISQDEFWKTAEGTFSDICLIAPALKVAAVNFSSAYYKAHTVNEYVDLGELREIIEHIGALIERTVEDDVDKFEYIPRKYSFRDDYKYGCYGNGWSYDDYGYDDYYFNRKSKSWHDFYIVVYNSEKKGIEEFVCEEAVTKLEAVGEFLSYFTTKTYDDIIEVYSC